MQDVSQLLKAFFESVETGIRISDAEGKIVLVNQKYCSLFGYTKEELIGKPFSLLLPPEQRQKAFETYKEQFAGQAKEASPTHWRARKKEGKEIKVAVKSFNICLGSQAYRVAMVREAKRVLTDMNRQEFYATILNNIDESVFVTDLQGRVIYWNKGSEKLYKCPEEEALEKKIQQYWPGLDLTQVIDSLMNGNTQYEFLHQPYQPTPEEQLYIDLKITPFLDELEIFTGLTFISKDITEKYKGKQELIRQRNMLASLVESQTNFLIRLDPQGHFTYMNNAFLSSGIIQESRMNQKFQDYIHPDDLELWREKFEPLLSANYIQKFELRLLKSKGEIIWTHWEFVLLPGNSGSSKELQGVGLDNTARKKTEKERDRLLVRMQSLNEELQANEEELRQNLEKTLELNHFILKSEKKFKSLLENSFEAIILYDEQGFITYASPSVTNTLGYPAEEMLGKKGMSFIHQDDKAQTKALLAKMMEKPGNRVYILQRVKRKDDSYIWTEAYTINLLHDENVRAVVSNFRDVTEKVEAEEKLRSNEAFLNLAQHVANLGSAEFDLLTGTVKNSSGVYAIYDYDLESHSEEEFNGFAYTHPEDVKKIQALFKNEKEPGPEWIKNLAFSPEEALKEAETIPFEYRIISAKGQLKYLRSKSRFLRDEQGKPVKAILTIQDVSEEKQRERLLDETSRISKIGGWELNLQNNKISWTLQTYSLFDISPTENLTVEKATAFYLPEYRTILQTAFHALITEGTPFDLELKMISGTGREVWVRMLGKAETVNDKVVLAKGTMQDITAKKEAEREIQEYAERLRIANQAAGIGIWEWDLQKGQLIWDQQMRAMYDIPESKKKIQLEDFKNAIHPDDLSKVQALSEPLPRNKQLESEFRIVTASGIKWIKSYAKLFQDEEGKPIRLIGINWDISWLKETEEALRKNNEELLKTNTELDHFVYSTSHNLRAPLTSILGIVNLIKNYPQGADLHTYINLIEKSITKLDETIQEIADYSRNTRLELSLEPVDFESVIEEAIESLSFLEQSKKAHISYVTPSKGHFLSDSSRLKMIFTNLISNALKYANPAQKEPFIFILVEYQKEGVSIKIKDNGIGIAKEYQGRIFNMFFRASSKSTGSGLGLYIVKEAVSKLGGSLGVDSILGEGTEFSIFLPRPAIQ